MKKKRKKRKTKKQLQRQRRLLVAAGILTVIFVALGVFVGKEMIQGKNGGETRAIWLAYMDYKALGLYNKKEAVFRKNAEAFFQEAKANSINTVYFHVRAFRDAAYKSQTFPMSRYLWSKKKEIPYDPLEIMVGLAEKHGMELHAWLNPYRNRDFDQDILDPADENSTTEILLCVEEILGNYDVDGIHFDDYFYQEDSQVPEEEMMENVNRMVQAIYSKVKAYGQEIQFGISPAGNIGYCQSIGADVKTWMSQEGYVDYIMPQIYWTDQHSASWREKMFTDTLDEWIELNQGEIPMYPGLALYRAGEKAKDDPGWHASGNNVAQQVRTLREKGCHGFALFSARDLFRQGAREEIKNYQGEVINK
ncbi:hypothetical protein D3Z38_17420 [Clostridiales bacterium]|nr:hypothetical protein [Clostridiales bacterium]